MLDGVLESSVDSDPVLMASPSIATRYAYHKLTSPSSPKTEKSPRRLSRVTASPHHPVDDRGQRRQARAAAAERERVGDLDAETRRAILDGAGALPQEEPRAEEAYRPVLNRPPGPPRGGRPDSAPTRR